MSTGQIAPRQPPSGQRARTLRESWALAPATLRAAVVCFGVSGALLVAQAVMLALGFGGIMRHLLTLASWLFPDEWGLWGDAAGHIAVIVRVIGIAFGAGSLLGAAACWAVTVQCLHGSDAGRWCATILTACSLVWVAGGVGFGMAVTVAVVGTVLLRLPDSNGRFRQVKAERAARPPIPAAGAQS